jgi:hypothetical protein
MNFFWKSILAIGIGIGAFESAWAGSVRLQPGESMTLQPNQPTTVICEQNSSESQPVSSPVVVAKSCSCIKYNGVYTIFMTLVYSDGAKRDVKLQEARETDCRAEAERICERNMNH